LREDFLGFSKILLYENFPILAYSASRFGFFKFPDVRIFYILAYYTSEFCFLKFLDVGITYIGKYENNPRRITNKNDKFS